MRKLSQLEIDKVTKIINNIVNEGEIEALCIYGSQIAGYSKPDSDYDVILDVDADVTDTMRLRCKGKTGHTIRWMAVVNTVEVAQ